MTAEVLESDVPYHTASHTVQQGVVQEYLVRPDTYCAGSGWEFCDGKSKFGWVWIDVGQLAARLHHHRSEPILMDA